MRFCFSISAFHRTSRPAAVTTVTGGCPLSVVLMTDIVHLIGIVHMFAVVANIVTMAEGAHTLSQQSERMPSQEARAIRAKNNIHRSPEESSTDVGHSRASFDTTWRRPHARMALFRTTSPSMTRASRPSSCSASRKSRTPRSRRNPGPQQAAPRPWRNSTCSQWGPQSRWHKRN